MEGIDTHPGTDGTTDSNLFHRVRSIEVEVRLYSR